METKLHYEMPECQRSPRHIGAWNLAIPGKANYPIRPAAPPLSIRPALPCLAGMFSECSLKTTSRSLKPPRAPRDALTIPLTLWIQPHFLLRINKNRINPLPADHDYCRF